MPTYDWLPSFGREYLKLSETDRALFMSIVAEMVEDMRTRRPFRPELRVHQVSGVWEVTWGPGGRRATFEYGERQRAGEQHLIWRHIGKHDTLDHP